MTKKQVEIVNKTGLHARPASDFVLEAKKYESKITICRENGVPVNGKIRCTDSGGRNRTGNQNRDCCGRHR